MFHLWIGGKCDVHLCSDTIGSGVVAFLQVRTQQEGQFESGIFSVPLVDVQHPRCVPCWEMVEPEADWVGGVERFGHEVARQVGQAQ